MSGLYLHVPFCLSKCPYCDFYSERYSREAARRYKEAVLRNLRQCGEAFDTVYFGGGTPVLLAREIAEILPEISVSDGAEISVEANPCVCGEERLLLLREGGVNRLSVGVQSMREEELRLLGRRHTAKQAEDALKNAYRAGFRNLSADMMLGLPEQSLEDVRETVRALAALPVTHISAYLLKIEKNTPFFLRGICLPDEEKTAELYLFAARELEENGFVQYEISNFAKKGYECRHNLNYWRCGEYLGIGPSAHSYYKRKRFCAACDLNAFLRDERQETAVTDENPGGFEEFAMLRLRLREGLSFADCGKFGVGKETMMKRCEKIPRDCLNVSERGISLTKRGFLLSNAVIGKLLGY